MCIEPLIRIKPMARRLVDGEDASFDTIYRWLLNQIKHKNIPSYRIGKVDHVRASEVEKLLQKIKMEKNNV